MILICTRAHTTTLCHAMCVVVNSAVRSGNSCKTENADNGKTNGRGDTRAMNCVQGWNERETSKPLHIYTSMSLLPSFQVRLFFSHRSLYTNPFVIPFYIKHNTYTPHSGQGLQTCNAYGSSYMYTVDPTLSLSQQQQTNKQKQLMLKTKQDELN